MSDQLASASGASAAGYDDANSRNLWGGMHDRATGLYPTCSHTHTDDTTMGGTTDGTRNLGQALSAAAGGSQLAEVFAQEADDGAEAAAASILAQLQERDQSVPGAMIMAASELVTRGLQPQDIVALLHDRAGTDAEAMKIFNQLQREARHEQALMADERRSAERAVAAMDPTGAVDAGCFASERPPFSPAASTPGAAQTEDAAALRARVDLVVLHARTATLDSSYETARAMVQTRVPIFLQRDVAQLLSWCRSCDGHSLQLLESFLESFGSDAAMPWAEVCRAACDHMERGCRPLVAWAIAMEQYRRTRSMAVGSGGVLLPSGGSAASLIDHPLPAPTPTPRRAVQQQLPPRRAGLAAGDASAMQFAIAQHMGGRDAVHGLGAAFPSEVYPDTPRRAAFSPRDRAFAALPPAVPSFRDGSLDGGSPPAGAALPAGLGVPAGVPLRSAMAGARSRSRSPSPGRSGAVPGILGSGPASGSALGLPAPLTYAAGSSMPMTPAMILSILHCDAGILACPIWYGAAPADGRVREFVYAVRRHWLVLLEFGAHTESDVVARRAVRAPILVVASLVVDLTHSTTDGGLSWGSRRARVHEGAGGELIYQTMVRRTLEEGYSSLTETFASAIRQVPALTTIHSSVQLHAERGHTADAMRYILDAVDGVYLSSRSVSTSAMWYGFTWSVGWSGYYMANRLFELAIRLGRDEALRLERFDEVVRSARQEALARGNDEAYRVASSIHDRFVNIRQPTASTLKQIVDVLRYDSAGLEALPAAASAPLHPPPRERERERRLREREERGVHAGGDADRLSEDMQGLALEVPVLAAEQVPLATLEIPELRAIMAEPGFAERVKTSGVRLSRGALCLDVVRLLSCGLLPRLQNVKVPWHGVFNMLRRVGICSHGVGEWGLICPICAVCNTRMTAEMSYTEWANPGPTSAERREIKDVPANVIITHPLFQCFHVRRLAQQVAKGRADLAWMLTELDSTQVQRILVASMIYQERAGK